MTYTATDPLVYYADAVKEAIEDAYAAGEIKPAHTDDAAEWPWELTAKRAYRPATKCEASEGLLLFVIPTGRPRKRNGRTWKMSCRISLVILKRLDPGTTTGTDREEALQTETDQLMAFATSLEDWAATTEPATNLFTQEAEHELAYLPDELDQAETFCRVIKLALDEGSTHL